MPSRQEILEFIAGLLDVDAFDDHCHNGLQVAGPHEVTRVGAGVSATSRLFERAAADGVDLLLTHHGLLWKPAPLSFNDRFVAKLRLLTDNGINLASYHLPLDAHPGIGNNALICDALGLERTGQSFAVAGGRPLGLVGTLAQPLGADAFARQVEQHMGQPPLVLGDPTRTISRVAVCSGGAQRYIEEAIDLGADAMITGEASEPTMAAAEEGGITFYAAGHYATEVFGVRELVRLVGVRFGIPHSFYPLPNPV